MFVLQFFLKLLTKFFSIILINILKIYWWQIYWQIVVPICFLFFFYIVAILSYFSSFLIFSLHISSSYFFIFSSIHFIISGLIWCYPATLPFLMRPGSSVSSIAISYSSSFSSCTITVRFFLYLNCLAYTFLRNILFSSIYQVYFVHFFIFIFYLIYLEDNSKNRNQMIHKLSYGVISKP